MASFGSKKTEDLVDLLILISYINDHSLRMPRCICEGKPWMKMVQQTLTSVIYQCPECGRTVAYTRRSQKVL